MDCKVRIEVADTQKHVRLEHAAVQYVISLQRTDRPKLCFPGLREGRPFCFRTAR